MLSELAADLPGLIRLYDDADVTEIVVDSRRATRGSLFVAMIGSKSDGHDFVSEALRNGAAAVVVSREIETSSPMVFVHDTTDALWRLSKRLYGDASKSMIVVGITGTNGKTTTAWLTQQALNRLGVDAAYVGTLGAIHGNERFDMDFTTPFPPTLFSLLAKLHSRGARAVIMEVSSHALAQRRVDGVEFDVALFTNLSQDHLDFHGTMDEYFAAKRRLFGDLEQSKRLLGIANCDDEWGRRLLDERLATVSFGETCGEVRILRSNVALDSLSVEIEVAGQRAAITVPLGATFNVMNIAATVAILITLGHSLDDIATAMAHVSPPPGRFESVPTGTDYQVIVDYAHTPDALSKLLRAVRELKPSRIITVFGCGGDRDNKKRPMMMRAAEEFSDVVYVTSDNPRTEDPAKIIEEILAGATGRVKVRQDPDRKSAIRAAIRDARSGDVVVIAGKGHEDYQILSHGKIHFDDREVAAEAIKEKAVCA